MSEGRRITEAESRSIRIAEAKVADAEVRRILVQLPVRFPRVRVPWVGLLPALQKEQLIQALR